MLLPFHDQCAIDVQAVFLLQRIILLNLFDDYELNYNNVGASKQGKEKQKQKLFMLLTRQIAHGKYCHRTKPEPVHP